MHFVASDARRRRSCLLGPTNSILEATTHLAWNLSMKMIENLMGEVCKVQDDRTEVYKSRFLMAFLANMASSLGV
jgi:hypothetical protein